MTVNNNNIPPNVITGTSHSLTLHNPHNNPTADALLFVPLTLQLSKPGPREVRRVSRVPQLVRGSNAGLGRPLGNVHDLNSHDALKDATVIHQSYKLKDTRAVTLQGDGDMLWTG